MADCLSDFLTLLCTLQVNTITLERSELLARGVRELQWCGGVVWVLQWCCMVVCGMVWCGCGGCYGAVGVVGATVLWVWWVLQRCGEC